MLERLSSSYHLLIKGSVNIANQSALLKVEFSDNFAEASGLNFNEHSTTSGSRKVAELLNIQCTISLATLSDAPSLST